MESLPMTPHDDDGRYFPEWLQREPDEFWDRQRSRVRIWRFAILGLTGACITIAAWALVSCGILR
ncbi:hypothetical protein [Tsuneonella sp. HG222]